MNESRMDPTFLSRLVLNERGSLSPVTVDPAVVNEAPLLLVHHDSASVEFTFQVDLKFGPNRTELKAHDIVGLAGIEETPVVSIATLSWRDLGEGWHRLTLGLTEKPKHPQPAGKDLFIAERGCYKGRSVPTPKEKKASAAKAAKKARQHRVSPLLSKLLRRTTR